MKRTYEVRIEKEALRALERLDGPLQRRVARRIDGLAWDPRPPGAKALQGGHAGLHRVRLGDVRVVYAIRDGELLVLVVKVGHRGDIYR